MSGVNSAEQRFEPPRFSEPAEWYEPGGLCPVRLQQRLGERYQVIRKLGWGSYATVWLAKDDQSDRYVALKIGLARGSRMRQEFEALQLLSGQYSSHGVTQFTQNALDSFDCVSINGTHPVIVLEPLGQSLAKHLDIQSRDGTASRQPRMPFAREISKQIVQGVDHIHANGLVHRDIQPRNILFALQTDLRFFDEYQLQQLENDPKDLIRVRRLDRRALDGTTPPYLVDPRPLDDGVSLNTPCHNLTAVITDFGAASRFEDVNDGFHAYPSALKPPEVALGIPMIAPQADIWSLGCVIFEIVCFQKLFFVDNFGTSRQERNNDLLRSITEVLGPFPKHLLDHWEGRSGFVDGDGVLLPHIVDEGISEPLQELISMYKPVDMSDEEEAEFLDFLRSMLRVQPHLRALTGELLGHPWLQRSM